MREIAIVLEALGIALILLALSWDDFDDRRAPFVARE